MKQFRYSLQGLWSHLLPSSLGVSLSGLLLSLMVDLLMSAVAAGLWNFAVVDILGARSMTILHAYAMIWLVNILSRFRPGPIFNI
jgi:hypothetical protein